LRMNFITTPDTSRLYTTQLLSLIVSTFLFSASFQMIIPELFDYLTALGGADYKGFIIAFFTITAGVSRPFSGKLTDTIGRVPVMVVGSLVCVVCSALYPFVATVTTFLLLRLLHGFSTGFKPTATAAYVADITTADRRGEAMSALGIGGALGMSIAPMLGSEITQRWGIHWMFAVSSFFAFLSVLILLNQIPESLQNKQKFSFSLLKIKSDEIFDYDALPPFVVQTLLGFASGVCLTLVPDLSKMVGIANKGLFFGISTGAALLIRLVAGKLSDRIGRVAVLKGTSICVFVGTGLMGFATDFLVFTLAAIVYGIAWGMCTPTLQAWTVDLVKPENRGRGLATMFIALELGIGLGAWLSQAIYQNEATRIGWAFYLSAFLGVVAWIYLLFQKEKGIFTPPQYVD
jgi:MFS family permease